jgi:hypothetical protein
MKPNEENVEALLGKLYKAPLSKRRAAMRAAARELDGKPTALLCDQAEASRLLSTSRFTIWRMAREGQLHPVTIRGCVRYKIAELEKLAGGVEA